jgi:hypothetical protein
VRIVSRTDGMTHGRTHRSTYRGGAHLKIKFRPSFFHVGLPKKITGNLTIKLNKLGLSCAKLRSIWA